MMKPVLLGLVIVGLAGCGKEAPEAHVKYQKDPTFVALGAKGEQALAAFHQACPQFQAFASDFENIKLSSHTVATPRELGWHQGAELSFKVKDQPTHTELIQSRSFGHNCWISMGGGDAPGIVSSKQACSSICGATDANAGGSYYMAVPEMAVLESVEEAKAIEDKRVAAGASDVISLTKKALKGSYQAQRNLAYEYQHGRGSAPYDPPRACAWRGIIMASGSPKVDESDQSNLELACGRLTPAQKEQAARIFSEIAEVL
ncbi:hypothetical protein HA051_08220 [Chromobacterium vaccinii]|nr:hypothetical protein [Chromobacterium vaccinii]